MPIRSVSDKRFNLRFLIMGAVITGFSLFCIYDGFIRYPHAQERAVAFEKLYEEKRQDEWDEFAHAKGWSTEPPEAPLTEEDFATKIKMQYAMAALTAVIGLPILISALRSRNRWIEMTDTGITSSWGESFNFDQVQFIDKKKWAKKGIAKVTYDDNGSPRKFVIDDFKFERPTTDQILYELEQRIDPEKIVNGPPEPPPGEPAEEPVGEYEADSATQA